MWKQIEAQIDDVRVSSLPCQIIEWFEQFTNGVAQTHTELGESQQVAESLAKEVTDFETTTQVHNEV